MVYIFRRASSNGARELVEGLMVAGTPAKRWSERFPRIPVNGDRVVCWGEALTVDAGRGITILNGAPIRSKYEDALQLHQAGVPTVEVSQALPPEAPPRLFTIPGDTRIIGRGAAQQLVEMLQGYLAQPDSTPVTWLPRRNNHIGGSDLLNPGRADYYSKKESISEEFRIHLFRGKSIRAGRKVVREGFEGHPWIRSFDGGWRIQYDGFDSSKEMRELSSKAVASLGLDFAAVDLGRTTDGRLIVLECNRAPGLEGGSVTAYVGAIQRWLAGGTE